MKSNYEVTQEAVRLLRAIDYKLLTRQRESINDLNQNIEMAPSHEEALDGIISLLESLHDFNEDFLLKEYPISSIQ